jgi:hypothetical protein
MRFAENASKARSEVGAGNRPDQRLRWTGIGVLLLLVAGLSWFVWSYVHKKMSLATPAQATHTTAVLSSHYATANLLSTRVMEKGPGGAFASLIPL